MAPKMANSPKGVRAYLPLSLALSFVAAASSLVVAPRDANAFCRTTTVSVAADFNPKGGQCWDAGIPLWWRNECVGYSLQKNASRQIAYDDAKGIIAEAFSKWAGATCATDGTGTSRPSIDVRDNGPVTCGLVEYNSNAGNQHVIVFRDDAWPHNDSSNTLALTTVTFNPDTGEIYDADMEINTAQTTMTVSDIVPADGFDFRSVMTHEAGHFLGLAHSGDTHATMYAHYTPGATLMRNLTSDDVSGICTVYAPNGSRAVDPSVDATGIVAGEACNAVPRKGFSTECKANQPAAAKTTTSGCSASPLSAASGSSTALGGLSLGLVGVVATAARRRRRKPAAS